MKRQWFSVIPRERGKYPAIGYLFGMMTNDVIEATAERLAQMKRHSVEDIRRAERNLVGFSDKMQREVAMLMDFLHRRVYWSPEIKRMYRQAEEVIETLFNAFLSDEQLLPARELLALEERVKTIPKRCRVSREHIKRRFICDYIASLTDQQALREYERIKAS